MFDNLSQVSCVVAITIKVIHTARYREFSSIFNVMGRVVRMLNGV